MCPVYSYHCMKCGSQRIDMRTIEQRHDGPYCDRCRNKMLLTIDTPPAAVVKNPAVPKKS